MLDRLSVDPRVIHGRGGVLPSGRVRLHAKDLRPGDILTFGRDVVLDVEERDDLVTVHTAERLDSNREPRGRTRRHDWKRATLVTVEPRDGRPARLEHNTLPEQLAVLDDVVAAGGWENYQWPEERAERGQQRRWYTRAVDRVVDWLVHW